MPIITLTSDWGLKDHYLSAVKGSIYNKMPEANIVDISHEIPIFDILQASFILKNSCFNFPSGTIHIIAINTEESIETPHLVVKYAGQYFIGADNGIFALIFDQTPEKIIELDVLQESDYFTFSAKDVFVQVACFIAKGGNIDELGSKKDNFNEKIMLNPVVDDNSIKGAVIYIDIYENIITNISESTFKKASKGRPFTISFRSPGYEISQIHHSYSDVIQAEKLALFSTTGFLEIAINQGKASSLLGLKLYDPIWIYFE